MLERLLLISCIVDLNASEPSPSSVDRTARVLSAEISLELTTWVSMPLLRYNSRRDNHFVSDFPLLQPFADDHLGLFICQPVFSRMSSGGIKRPTLIVVRGVNELTSINTSRLETGSSGVTHVSTKLVVGIEELFGVFVVQSIPHVTFPLISDRHGS